MGKADYYVLTIIITQLKQGATLIRRILWTGQALTSVPLYSRFAHYRAGARQALFKYSIILPI
ncbi:MAG: hypothetical protein IID16_13245 [Candidatus Marinimicrobia bacterium]|nr:hypothetical protein [Candidatus Neomarinimicrobiota bacterium]